MKTTLKKKGLIYSKHDGDDAAERRDTTRGEEK